MRKRKALLIIDMQKGSFTEETPRYDVSGVVQRINQLAASFRANHECVIFVQHDGTGTGSFEKNTEAWQLLDELEVDAEDVLLDKYANDVFYRSKLESILKDCGANQLFITGCATDFCVESTIQSALVKDYSITVIEDGHTTGERPHLPAEKVIEHYNWVWKNMLPTQGSICVRSTKEILNEKK